MKVHLALLADYAIAQDDGKLSILGAGLHSLPAPVLPYVHGNLAFALQILFAEEELDSEQAFRIEVHDPSGNQVDDIHGFALRITRMPWQQGQIGVPIVHNFRDFSFNAYGLFNFMLLRMDGTELATVVLEVAATTGEGRTESRSERAARLIGESFRLFRQGEVDRALEMVDRAIEEDPESPRGHNNRGFILLATGRGDKALEEFEKARQYGYSETAILEANIASTLYLRGEYAASVSRFQDLVSANVRSPLHTFLTILTRQGIGTIVVQSPADYVALMALNAARGALAAGMTREAEQFMQMATTGRVSFGKGSTFSTYLDELIQDLKNPPALDTQR